MVIARHQSIQEGFRYTYNGMCEVIQRQLIILSVFKNYDLSFRELSLFDFFVQHGGDIGMPVSLHYPNPNRGQSYNVRIDMIDNVLALLSSCGVISKDTSGNTFRLQFDIWLEGNRFSTGYLNGLCYASEFLESQFSESREDTLEFLSGRLMELQSGVVVSLDSPVSRLTFLQTQYALDYQRLVGLRESISFQRELFERSSIVDSKYLPTAIIFDYVGKEVDKELLRIPSQYQDLTRLMDDLSIISNPGTQI